MGPESQAQTQAHRDGQNDAICAHLVLTARDKLPIFVFQPTA
jgi:hypothetical protein